ncbi:MAG: DUF4886 domain-containing protein [Victivallaceae bacterium]|nr:DUF4886 domain-containing protein [Victivallaceae bacterium]
MKNFKLLLFSLFCFALALSGAEQVKELKVFTIGNSFANSIFRSLPAIVEADPSCKLTLVSANLGGCSLERHWKEHLKSEKNSEHKPYSKHSLRDRLIQEKWDIVTIQQVSHKSWQPETYQPYAENIIALVKQLAPTAEIVIQQTWSYNAGDSRLSPEKWKMNQQEMYDKLTYSYLALAKKYNCRVIPSGMAVQLYREAMGTKLIAINPLALAAMKEPEVPDNNDVVGNFFWRNNKKTGKSSLVADWIHMNDSGKYLQGLVWYGFLFGKDPNEAKYAPKGMNAEKVTLLKKCAAEAIVQFPQMKK